MADDSSLLFQALYRAFVCLGGQNTKAAFAKGFFTHTLVELPCAITYCLKLLPSRKKQKKQINHKQTKTNLETVKRSVFALVEDMKRG